MAAKQPADVRRGEIPKISAKDVTYDETPIGRGGYGYVYRGTHADLGTVAIKTMITDGILPTRHQRIFKSESKALWELSHPSVVRLLGLIMEENNYSLILEYMHFGSLSSFRTDFPNISWSIIISILRDVITGMEFLHSKSPPILHLDMKSDNILINRKIRAKITDFGLAQWKTMTRTITQSQRKTEDVGRKGTVTHVPPEVWNNVNIPPNKAYDIYGFGIVVWEAITGARPFGNTSDDIIPKAVLSGQRPDIATVSTECPAKLSSVMTQCWSQKPDSRPNFSELKPQIDVLFESFAHTVPKDLQDLEKEIGELYSAEDIGGDTAETTKSETLYDVVSKINPPPRTPTPPDVKMTDIEQQHPSPSTTATANQTAPVASTSNQNAAPATQSNDNAGGSSNQTAPNQATPATTANQTASSSTPMFSEDQMKAIRRILFDSAGMLLMYLDPSLCFSVYQINIPTQRQLKSPGVLMKILEEDPELKMDLSKRGTDYLSWLFNPQEMKEIIRRNRPTHVSKPGFSEKMRNVRKEREKREEEEISRRGPPQIDTRMHKLEMFLKRYNRGSSYDYDDDDEPTIFGDLGYKVVKAFYNPDMMKYAMGEGRSAMMAPMDQEVLDVLRNPDRLVMMLERDPNFRAKLMKINSSAVMKIISQARIPYPQRRNMRHMNMFPFELERDLMDMDLDEDDMMMRRMNMMGDMDELDMRRYPRGPSSMEKSRMSNLMKKKAKPSMKKPEMPMDRLKNKTSSMKTSASAAKPAEKPLPSTQEDKTSSMKTSASATKPAEKPLPSTQEDKTSSMKMESSASATKPAEKPLPSTQEDKSKTLSAANPSTASVTSTSDSSGAKKTDTTKNVKPPSKPVKEERKIADVVKEEGIKAPIQRQTLTQPLSTVYPPGIYVNEAGRSAGDTVDDTVSQTPEQVNVGEGERTGKTPASSSGNSVSETRGSTVKVETLGDSDRASGFQVKVEMGSNRATVTSLGINSSSMIQIGNNNAMFVSTGKRGQNPEGSSNSKKVKKNGKLKSPVDENKKESDDSDS